MSAGLMAQDRLRLSDTTGQLLFAYEAPYVFDAQGAVVFTLSGNILFRGKSRENEDMAFLIKDQDVFDKTTGYIYNADGSEALFSVHKGRFYSGTGRFNDQLLLTLEMGNGLQTLAFTGFPPQYAGMITGRTMQASPWAALFMAWIEEGTIGRRLALERDLRRQATQQQEVKGRIRLVYSSGFDHDWVWDGRLLKPRWGNRPEDEWLFDGKSLVPYWGNTFQQEWAWDGQYLKPAWGEVPEFTFIWDSSAQNIRPFWEYQERYDWIIEDDTAYPKWDQSGRNEWVIEGRVPVPVIALIVLGIADR